MISLFGRGFDSRQLHLQDKVDCKEERLKLTLCVANFKRFFVYILWRIVACAMGASLFCNWRVR